MRKTICLIGIVLLALALGVGCTTPGRPPAAKVIGGGAQIEWQASQDGTAILVEAVTGKVIMTRSLKANDQRFTFDYTVAEEAEVVKKALGNMPANPEFVLYFVPEPSSK